jgi:6-phosphogluconolactonase (cycloisomerase 2 family)
MPRPRKYLLAFCSLALNLTLVTALSTPFAMAQSDSPVAYIYVSSNYSGSNNRVVGYAANADGQLTQISGSPWADNLSYLATNGSYLFGSTNIANDNGKNIFSYQVGSNGALKYIGATNIQDLGSTNGCNQANNLRLDHTGSYLYVFVRQADCNTEVAYQSFAVNKSTGLLNYLGVTAPNAFSLGYPLTMLADNNFAYAGGNGAEDDEICGFSKASNGNLVDLNGGVCNTAWPGTTGQPSGSNGDVRSIAADPTNHLAAIITYSDAYTGALIANKIATIAINTSNGSQSTSSTYANMPTTAIQQVQSIAMSRSGELLAVGGSNGLEIFNFNPNGQASLHTGLLTTDSITAMYWDNNDHLYAISNTDNALHVYTVTSTNVKEAPGSPYSIPRPVALAGNALLNVQCPEPASDGVNVCLPDEHATLTSPVAMNAAATLSGGVYRFELWANGTKVLSERDYPYIHQSVSLAPGTYQLIFSAYNTAGVHEYGLRDITVTK